MGHGNLSVFFAAVGLAFMSKRLIFEHLVDLEMQLRRDKEVYESNPDKLRERDARIGHQIGAHDRDGAELYLAWLKEVQRNSSEQRTSGRQIVQYLSLLFVVLVIAGLVFGSSTVAGLLLYDANHPVNVVFFWLAVIGVQLLLLCGWVIAVLPLSWLGALPGASGIQLLLRLIAQALPLGVGWLVQRFSHENQQRLQRLRGNAVRFDRLYGKLRFWLLVEATQTFALAYNVGAVVALVAITYGSDPAFCWKSTMLDSQQAHAVTNVIAAPWSTLMPPATLSQQDIESTRYWSFDESFTEKPNDAAPDKAGWRRWSLFLLMSLLLYCLMPRCLTYWISSSARKRSIRQATLNHVEFQRLRDRLRANYVTTTDPNVEQETGLEPRPPVERQAQAATVSEAGDGPFPVLRCSGVKLGNDEIGALIAANLGKSISTVDAVLGPDPADDAAALDRVTQGKPPAEVLVIVEAWEPPVSEYIDLLAHLRERLGDNRIIDVLLYNRRPDGTICVPKPKDVGMWRNQMECLGDPWLRVESLAEASVA